MPETYDSNGPLSDVSPTDTHQSKYLARFSSNLRKCSVQLLDDTSLLFEFKKTDPASVLFDKVCERLGLIERDYFGLRFMDDHKYRYWLDLTKPIVKQADSPPLIFAFRVKFYPADPSILKEELTRYLLVSQLRRDMIHGRFYCPQNDMAILSAYIIQAELGNYNQKECIGNYVSQFKIVSNQSPKLEEKIAAEHKKLKNLKPSQCDVQFLKKAASSDIYGYAPYSVKDSKLGQVYLGSVPRGVVIYENTRRIHDMKWDDIEDMDCSGKDFYLYTTKAYADAQSNIQENPNASILSTSSRSSPVHDATLGSERPPSALSNRSQIETKKKRPHLKLICPNAKYSKHMWKYLMGQKAFFTKPTAVEVKPIVRRHFLTSKSTFRWSPTTKTLQELQEIKGPLRTPGEKCPEFHRCPLIKQAPREERATDAAWANKFHTLPGRKKKSETVLTGGDSPIMEHGPQWGPPSETPLSMVAVPLAVQQLSAPNTTVPVITEHSVASVQETPLGRISTGTQAAATRPTVLKYESHIAGVEVQKVLPAGSVAASSTSAVASTTISKSDDMTSFHKFMSSQKQSITKRLSLAEEKDLTDNADTVSLKGKTSKIKDWISTKISTVTSGRSHSPEKSLKEHVISHDPTTPVKTQLKTNGWLCSLRSNNAVQSEMVTTAEPKITDGHVGCRFVRYSMLALLLLIFTLLLLVAAMEYRGETWRRTLDNQPFIDNFRRSFYDPWRGRTCQWFGH